SWLFVLWGLAHGILLVIEHALKQIVGKSRLGIGGPGAKLALCSATFSLICLTWVLFRAESLETAMALYAAMLRPLGTATLLSAGDILSVALAIAGLLAAHTFMRNRSFDRTLQRLPWPLLAALIAAMLLSILLAPGEERDFIYFEF
ncbi:MAG: hypothetical protein AAFX10_12165, partial [Pseudomonadota bacterium]